MPREAEEAVEDENGLLQRAIKYCWSSNFLDVFRSYFRKHAHHFEKVAEEKTEEHDLVFQELFQVCVGLCSNLKSCTFAGHHVIIQT